MSETLWGASKISWANHNISFLNKCRRLCFLLRVRKLCCWNHRRSPVVNGIIPASRLNRQAFSLGWKNLPVSFHSRSKSRIRALMIKPRISPSLNLHLQMHPVSEDSRSNLPLQKRSPTASHNQHNKLSSEFNPLSQTYYNCIYYCRVVTVISP